MAVSRERRVPAWAQIADAVRAQISAGELAPEDRLPTEAELMARHDVARSTVRQALTALVNEGLIVPRAPRGYFVRNRKPLFLSAPTRVPGATRVSRDGSLYGRPFRRRTGA